MESNNSSQNVEETEPLVCPPRENDREEDYGSTTSTLDSNTRKRPGVAFAPEVDSFRRRLMQSFDSWTTSFRRTSQSSLPITSPITTDRRRISSSGSVAPEHQSGGVAVWTIILILAFAFERLSFKALVDRAGPFRLFASLAVAGLHTLWLGILVAHSALNTRSFNFGVFHLSLSDLGLVMVLDSIHLASIFLSGSYVTPVLTVTLVHMTIPLVVIFSQCSREGGICSCFLSVKSEPETNSSSRHDDTRSSNIARDSVSAVRRFCAGYKSSQLFGATLVFIGAILGLCPSLLYIIDSPVVQGGGHYMTRVAWNTFMFAASFFPAAASQLLKEQMMMDYRQPVDDNQLNLVLNAGQLIFVAILSPLLYPLQGLASGPKWIQDYPARDTSINFLDGLLCFFGVLDEQQMNSFAEVPSCGPISSFLVIVHVVSTLLMTQAVCKLVLLGVNAYQCMIGGTLVGGLGMWLYGYYFEIRSLEKGIGMDGRHIVDILNVSSFLVLLSGLEMYHRTGLPDVEFETVYPEAESLEEEAGGGQ